MGTSNSRTKSDLDTTEHVEKGIIKPVARVKRYHYYYGDTASDVRLVPTASGSGRRDHFSGTDMHFELEDNTAKRDSTPSRSMAKKKKDSQRASKYSYSPDKREGSPKRRIIRSLDPLLVARIEYRDSPSEGSPSHEEELLRMVAKRMGELSDERARRKEERKKRLEEKEKQTEEAMVGEGRNIVSGDQNVDVLKLEKQMDQNMKIQEEQNMKTKEEQNVIIKEEQAIKIQEDQDVVVKDWEKEENTRSAFCNTEGSPYGNAREATCDSKIKGKDENKRRSRHERV